MTKDKYIKSRITDGSDNYLLQNYVTIGLDREDVCFAGQIYLLKEEGVHGYRHELTERTFNPMILFGRKR
jgi:hypothetical protein